MGGWALHGGICQANKGPALPGTGSLEGGLQRNSSSRERGTTFFPFPSGYVSTEELGNWLTPSHLGPQASGRNLHLLHGQIPTTDEPFYLFSSYLHASNQTLLKKVYYQTAGFHYNSGLLPPNGTKGGRKFAACLWSAHTATVNSYFKLSLLPWPFWRPLHKSSLLSSSFVLPNV